MAGSRSNSGSKSQRINKLQRRLICCGNAVKYLDRCPTCDTVAGVNRKAYYKSVHYAARVM